MKKSILGLLVLVILSMMLGGCATILSGEKQKINITTDDPSKKYNVRIDGQPVSAPGIVEVKRENKEKILTVDECPGQEIMLQKEVNPVFFVNILSGGVFGSTTDYATDSMWKYEPSNITIKCK